MSMEPSEQTARQMRKPAVCQTARARRGRTFGAWTHIPSLRLQCPPGSALVTVACAMLSAMPVSADTALERVVRAETERVELIRRIMPSAVCIYDLAHRSGGSGVLIDPEGYGVTNYHVVAGMLDSRKGWGGLADGVLYELQVLGVDVTGDVAMFRLLPPEGWRHSPEQEDAGAERRIYRFPFAELGDSEKVRVGDATIVLGNPFSLSEAHTPSVTQGIITGVHRYQEGSRGNLVYTDCLQTDASVNPGNSGGPLFNTSGEVIGINGRISVNTRGRFNVGFGYAISSNQIKRFIPTLRAGLLAKHGTWQARVTNTDTGVVFSEIAGSGPAYDAGLRVGHRLLSLDGVPITSANQVLSTLGTYPANWPVLLEVEREGVTSQIVVRLDPIEPGLRAPFVVDAEVNLREVRRVLRGFRRNVLGGRSELPPVLKWTVVRSYSPDREGFTKPPAFFEVSVPPAGPARMVERLEDGSVTGVIVYDSLGARQQTDSESEFVDLPRDEAMVLSALSVLQRDMVDSQKDLGLIGVSHAGADMHLASPGQRSEEHRPTAAPRDDLHDVVLRPHELIRWPLSADLEAYYAFDSETYEIITIAVVDALTGTKALVELRNPCDIGGMVWPCTIQVQADGYTYEDDLSAREPSP